MAFANVTFRRKTEMIRQSYDIQKFFSQCDSEPMQPSSLVAFSIFSTILYSKMSQMIYLRCAKVLPTPERLKYY